jgi:hypothetical protein
MATWLQFGTYATDLLGDMGTAETLIKKGFNLRKALNPDPGLDILLGVLGQGLSDASNPNLSPAQRVERILVAGGEAGITGVASNAVGVLGFLAGGGPVGYVAASITTSLYLDNKVWVDYNHTYFGAAGY